jgi:hypothetical protein
MEDASFAASRIKSGMLSVDMHDAAIYFEQAQSFLTSAIAFARQASMNSLVERLPKVVEKPKTKLTLVHSKD